jgi:hypothetical protein
VLVELTIGRSENTMTLIKFNVTYIPAAIHDLEDSCNFEVLFCRSVWFFA